MVGIKDRQGASVHDFGTSLNGYIHYSTGEVQLKDITDISLLKGDSVPEDSSTLHWTNPKHRKLGATTFQPC